MCAGMYGSVHVCIYVCMCVCIYVCLFDLSVVIVVFIAVVYSSLLLFSYMLSLSLDDLVVVQRNPPWEHHHP